MASRIPSACTFVTALLAMVFSPTAGWTHADPVIPIRLGGLSGKPALHVTQAHVVGTTPGSAGTQGPLALKAEGNMVVVTAPAGPARRMHQVPLAPAKERMIVATDRVTKGRVLDGPVTVGAREGKLVVVAQVPESRYIAGVVDGEMTASAAPQALRAQAIVARSFLYQSRRRHQSDGAWVCDQSHCQVWHQDAATPIVSAVTATIGLVVTGPTGQPLPVYYHASCGGSTVPVHLVYGGSPQPHLGGIRDVDCQAEPGWHFRTSVEAAAEALQRAKLIASGPVTAIQVSDQTPTGWPVSLRVDGAAPRTVSAYQAWLAFGQAWGWGKLPGLHFKLQQQGHDMIVQGRGIGHGIGLCQRGTMRLARQGKSAETILATYFPGTRVGRP